jgi:mRNA interferase MazF
LLPGPYQNVLICGISSKLHQLEANWDELIQPSDADFANSGLHRASSVRLSYLYAADSTEIIGTIGAVDSGRLARLKSRLRQHLI